MLFWNPLQFVKCSLLLNLSKSSRLNCVDFHPALRRMADNRYCVEYARLGTAGCKKCKSKIEKGSLRLGKVVPNPFTDSGGDMKQWFHPDCMFETFKRARATTKKIEDPSDLDGWDNVKDEDRSHLLEKMKELGEAQSAPKVKTPKKTPVKKAEPKNSPAKASSPAPKKSPSKASSSEVISSISSGKATTSSPTPLPENANHRDNSFREFRRICAMIAEEPSYLGKTGILKKFLSKGTDEQAFKGDLFLWLKLLLPGVVKRIYNLQNKQLVKLFSQIFGTNQDEMLTDLEQGDVAETVRLFFENSNKIKPTKKALLTLYDVENHLEELSKETKEEEQMRVLSKVTQKCTGNDLKMFIRLIKHDLRINAGAKHILEAVHDDAYEAFQASRDLKNVVQRILEQRKSNQTGPLTAQASLMTPILPMLAEACKSIEMAFTKCPNGMFAEVKYDGERVQVHKKGNQFAYYSRSLKPVLPHKVEHLKKYIPEAFQSADDLILDSEVLMLDTNTGEPLPFGTLGKHKKEAFQDAVVCLFVFDCIHLNGKSLMSESIRERKRILHENMVEVPNRVKFSEAKEVMKPQQLKDLIMEVLSKGLEGLVLKDMESIYEPGKRHWLKVKKDYLAQGAMADTADLLVLGAFYGTGQKGGMMSIFLMGCYDPNSKKFCTVTKVSGGHDDKTLERLQTELKMVKIAKDPSKVPDWLNVMKPMTPDFICEDPKETAVWEITGAEFSKAEIHTAKGISIRFPRVTRIRDDKTWKEATNLPELVQLFETSKDHSNLEDVLTVPSSQEIKMSIRSPVKKGKQESPAKGQRDLSTFIKKHPSTLSEKMEPALKKRLSSIFQGVKAYVSPSTSKADVLKRYLITYDADVVDDSNGITHFITDKSSSKIVPGCTYVSPKWVFDCVKNKKLLPENKYKVT